MENIEHLLESSCKTMIKTILSCLDNATKGTIYRIGPMPGLTAVRVTSGVRKNDSDEIKWGLPTASDYNLPGKDWLQYRDQPGRALEAMGWCVEKQTSWTAENPFEDVRSIRKQLLGEIEDVYHMEPVLIRKTDLYGSPAGGLEYPVDWQGNRIWQDTDYVVVAVIKIHFMPHTVRRDDKSTRVILELSRSLGTELLSLHLRETLSRAQKEFTRQRLRSCEILAHDLRNTLIKMGFMFSAINSQISIIREVWEQEIRGAFPDLEFSDTVLKELNQLVRTKLPLIPVTSDLLPICEALLAAQGELAALSILPQQGELWVRNKIRPKWEGLLSRSPVWDRDQVMGLLERLGRALNLGVDPDLIGKLNRFPPGLGEKWVKVAYTYVTSNNLDALDDVLDLLTNPDLPVPHKPQMRKVLNSLKSLVVTIPEVEETANRIIQSLRFGIGLEWQNGTDLSDILGFRRDPDEFGLAD